MEPNISDLSTEADDDTNQMDADQDGSFRSADDIKMLMSRIAHEKAIQDSRSLFRQLHPDIQIPATIYNEFLTFAVQTFGVNNIILLDDEQCAAVFEASKKEDAVVVTIPDGSEGVAEKIFLPSEAATQMIRTYFDPTQFDFRCKNMNYGTYYEFHLFNTHDETSSSSSSTSTTTNDSGFAKKVNIHRIDNACMSFRYITLPNALLGNVSPQDRHVYIKRLERQEVDLSFASIDESTFEPNNHLRRLLFWFFQFLFWKVVINSSIRCPVHNPGGSMENHLLLRSTEYLCDERVDEVFREALFVNYNTQQILPRFFSALQQAVAHSTFPQAKVIKDARVLSYHYSLFASSCIELQFVAHNNSVACVKIDRLLTDTVMVKCDDELFDFFQELFHNTFTMLSMGRFYEPGVVWYQSKSKKRHPTQVVDTQQYDDWYNFLKTEEEEKRLQRQLIFDHQSTNEMDAAYEAMLGPEQTQDDDENETMEMDTETNLNKMQ